MEKRSCPLKNSLQPAKSAKSVKIAKLTKSANFLHKTTKFVKLLWIKSAVRKKGGGRKETGDRRQEKGDVRKKIILKKFKPYNLADER